MEIENNLRNITVKDFIYQSVKSQIARHLPDDLKTIYQTLPQLPIISADNYFMHYSVYPLLKSSNPDKILDKVLQFQKEYSTSERFQQIKPLTTLDDQMSLINSVALTKYILEKIKEKIKDQNLVEQARQGDKQAQKQLQKALSTAGNKQLLQQAMKHASKFTRTASDLRELLGGKEAGKEPGTFRKILDLTDKVLKTEISDIITFSKRLSESLPFFAHIKKRKGEHGDEVAGYRMTKSISKAIARELALPDELFYSKLTGNGFLTREKLSVAEGAYYVLLDKSGSMEGEKTVWARSVALALYKMSKRKKRRFFLRFFDSAVHGLLEKPDEIVEALLKVQSDGGTDIDKAIKTALEDLKAKKLSELTNTILIITDGEDDVRDWRGELKAHSCELVSVMIQGDNESLRRSSTQYLKAQLDKAGALKLIQLIT